ncbi:DUF4870 family protein [Suttonella ornithocola]|uniref:Predicted membrane protein n=1 Tax=Suttonella ornithocola TaxID=279832 RepID=A0A380MQC1_9GAMM|nr:hypothetical protein [Suttonella ornithocola]SUO94502.1 Predicted membrane protein [Suttonella ornithocola]
MTFSQTNNNQTIALVVYILYIVSLFTGGLTAIIGVIMAYIYRSDSQDAFLNNHFTYQIRTFWIGLLYSIIATILLLVLVGYLLFIAIFVWQLVRCIKGIKVLNDNQPIANVTSWLF